MEDTDFLPIFYPLFNSLDKESVFKKLSIVMFYVLGLCTFFGGVYLFFNQIGDSKDFWEAYFNFLFLLASFLTLQIWRYRAKVISQSSDTGYAAIIVLSNFIKALGEIYSLYLVVIGLGATAIIWFSHHSNLFINYIILVPFTNRSEDYYYFYSSHTIRDGFRMLITTSILAFCSLLFTRFIGEVGSTLSDIVNNTLSLKPAKIEEHQETAN